MDRTHWDAVWEGRVPEEVTWFQHEPLVALDLIRGVAATTASVIDVGGGASRLVDHLLDDGYRDVTVLDITATPLDAAKSRIGAAADRVTWIVDDVREVDLGRTFDIWHDRAVFHFLTDAADRDRYLAQLHRAVAIGGHVVVATFGPDGPERCSGLPVRRYDTALMQDTLGDSFRLIDHVLDDHVSPTGVVQQFLYAVFRRAA